MDIHMVDRLEVFLDEEKNMIAFRKYIGTACKTEIPKVKKRKFEITRGRLKELMELRPGLKQAKRAYLSMGPALAIDIGMPA